MIEAAVFDLDGTLVQLPIDYELLFNEFRLIMRVPEVRPIVDTISKLDGKTKKTVFEAWDRAELAVLGRIADNDEGVQIYHGLEEKPRALVTLQGKAVVQKILEHHQFRFDFVLTREDSLFRIDQLDKAISLLKANPRNVLFVGNTDSDAVAAEKVGCQFHRVK